MSKFINEVRTELLTKRKAIYPPLTINHSSEFVNMTQAKEHRISVTWEVKTFIVDDYELKPMLENVLRELREAIFGEIRQKIIQLERAIYEYEHKKAVEILNEILKEIYG